MLAIISTLFLFKQLSFAQNAYDSLKIKLPKHYFKTIITLDSYSKPSKEIRDTSNYVSRRLQSYGVRQFVFSLNTPIATIERPSSDGISRNTHFLLTANYLRLRPIFSGISQHDLIKAGLGVRMLVNTDKKGVWFFDVSPFVTKDASYTSDPYYRIASTLVYSHNVNDHFNWRIGATKSFMWGNRLFLPFVGIRFGKLDKTHLSIQFPRAVNLNIPVSSNFRLSIYSKPQGGMFNFSNYDSIHNASATDATLQYSRYEINSGLRADVQVCNWFNFYIALGLSTRNNITFYSDKSNSRTSGLPYTKYFYQKNTAPSGFGNIGLVFKIGKTRSYYNNRNLYDAIDMNNNIGNTENIGNDNTQIPKQKEKLKNNINLESVQDLIDYNDF